MIGNKTLAEMKEEASAQGECLCVGYVLLLFLRSFAIERLITNAQISSATSILTMLTGGSTSL